MGRDDRKAAVIGVLGFLVLVFGVLCLAAVVTYSSPSEERVDAFILSFMGAFAIIDIIIGLALISTSISMEMSD